MDWNVQNVIIKNMSIKKKTYWKGIEQLKNNTEFIKEAQNEFPEYLPLKGSSDNSRRDFLKMMGFGIAAASVAACEAPVKKAIPYVNKPVEIDPTIANYYASTFSMGSDYCSIIVKTREGRPIKIDGNSSSIVSVGSTSSQVESSVLTLYDKQRLKGPLMDNKESSWDNIDIYIKNELSKLKASGKKTYIISNSICSPSSLEVINNFVKNNNGFHVQYDHVSYNGMLDANYMHFGKRKLPFYDFSKAKTIVSFDYDFLGSSFNHNLFNRQFTKTRKVNRNNKTMSRLYSFESNLSLTGANADHRIPIKSSLSTIYISYLYNSIARRYGAPLINIDKSKLSLINTDILNKVSEDLFNSVGESLIISGSNDKYVQLLINMINDLLKNYGVTIDTSKSYNIRNGDDKKMNKFLSDLKDKNVGSVIFLNCNPIYDHYLSDEIKQNLSNVSIKVSTSDRIDETSILCNVIAPDSHYLESWNDFEPIENSFSFSQPTISRIFNTRQVQDSFLKWNNSELSFYELLQFNWRSKQKLINSKEPFQIFWDKLLHDGVANFIPVEKQKKVSLINNLKLVSEAHSKISKAHSLIKESSNYELNIYQNVTVGNGIQSNNPWLQEMPDPISKVCWDNYISINPKDATELKIEADSGRMTTHILNLNISNNDFELPVIVQPGQALGTIGVALGYGRKLSGPVGNDVGFDALKFLDSSLSVQNLLVKNVKVSNTFKTYRIAQTQTHHTIMGRESIIQETNLDQYAKDQNSGKYQFKVATSKGFKKPEEVTLWKGHEYPNHHWVMAIDLNACTGCGACTVACQVENNVPVVGKEEVLNRREMAWLRIDRYYSSDADVHDLKGLEEASENPEVTFQPMMCQHCNNAPCETVCPVAATTHSTEGLNQMTYNRCIGTRYCANNCPYKVRRFNWFKYHDNKQFDKNISMNNDLGKMVLNPDVTVRARGVMEKCSFCVQRIQEGKLKARIEKRELVDGEINVACATACSADAIVFGDIKNKESRIFKLLQVEDIDKTTLKVGEERAYNVLDELRVSPNVWYLRKVRNKKLV